MNVKGPTLKCPDKLAHKYTGKLVYVWKGERKGRVGRVLSAGGNRAQIAFGGMTGATGVYTIKREYLIRYGIHVIHAITLLNPISSESLETLWDGSLPQRFSDKKQRGNLRDLIKRLIENETVPKQPIPAVEAAWDPTSTISQEPVVYNHSKYLK